MNYKKLSEQQCNEIREHATLVREANQRYRRNILDLLDQFHGAYLSGDLLVEMDIGLDDMAEELNITFCPLDVDRLSAKLCELADETLRDVDVDRLKSEIISLRERLENATRDMTV